jgi:hypothetical protein
MVVVPRMKYRTADKGLPLSPIVTAPRVVTILMPTDRGMLRSERLAQRGIGEALAL